MDKRPLKKLAGKPDEVRIADRTGLEPPRFETAALTRATLEPGWHWKQDLEPRVGTQSCEVTHLNYVISGRLRVVLDDGTEPLLEPGDSTCLPPGRDAWVEGDEPSIVLDMIGVLDVVMREAGLLGGGLERRAA